MIDSSGGHDSRRGRLVKGNCQTFFIRLWPCQAKGQSLQSITTPGRAAVKVQQNNRQPAALSHDRTAGSQSRRPGGKSPMAKQGLYRAAFAVRVWHCIARFFHAASRAPMRCKGYIVQVAISRLALALALACPPEFNTAQQGPFWAVWAWA